MKITHLVWAMALFFSHAYAQQYKYKYAKDLSIQYRFVEALPVWEEISNQALQQKLTADTLYRFTAEAAFYSENYRIAEKWYQKMLSRSKASTQDWSNYMKTLMYLGKSNRIPAVLDSALQIFPDDQSFISRKADWKQVMFNENLQSGYQIRKYKEVVKGEDFGAFPYSKGGILYTTNEHNHSAINKTYPRTGQNYLDVAVYDSAKVNQVFKFYQKPFWTDLFFKNQWRDVKRTRTHDGPVSFNPSNTMMFMTSNYGENDVENKVKNNRLKQRVFLVDGDNYNEIDFPFNDLNYSTGHATMDSIGNVYFISDRPGSMNNSADIWSTTYTEGEWTTPVNLGPMVNTDEDEVFPFISSKGILYFSSFGWNSIGGLDIFASELEGNKPDNIGVPLNSSADDFCYYVNEVDGKGFFSTNREAFVDKIYAFNKPVYIASLIVNLANCKGKALSKKTITITDLKNGEAQEFKTDLKGQTESFTLSKDRSYRVVFNGDAQNTSDSTVFLAAEEGEQMVNLNTYFKTVISKASVRDESGNPIENVRLNIYKHNKTVVKLNTDGRANYEWGNSGTEKVDSITANLINHNDQTVIIPSVVNKNCVDTLKYLITMHPKDDSNFIAIDLILYNFDKYDLRPEGKLELDKLVRYMNEHPDLRVELSSHTDSRGSDKYNMKLSKSRAQSCVNYIISKGISRKLIKAKGYGETKLVNKCSNGVRCNIKDHQANRRTVFTLIAPDETILDNNRLDAE